MKKLTLFFVATLTIAVTTPLGPIAAEQTSEHSRKVRSQDAARPKAVRPGSSAATTSSNKSVAVNGEELVRATALRELKIVKRLIGEGVDLEAQNSRGYTALGAACALNDVRMVELLLSHGADPNARDRRGLTPVHHAADRGNVVILRILQLHRADLHAEDARGKSPLQLLQAQDPRTVKWTEAELEDRLGDLLEKTRKDALGVAKQCRERAQQMRNYRRRVMAETQKQLDELAARAANAAVHTRRRRVYGSSPDPANTYSDAYGEYVIETHVDPSFSPDDFRVHDHEFPLPPEVLQLEAQADRHEGFARFLAEHCFPKPHALARHECGSIKNSPKAPKIRP